MKFLFIKLVIVCLFSLYKSDIPVHCLKSQIVGEWEFKATKPVRKEIGELYKMTCGHNLPSHESSSYKASMEMSLFTEKFRVNLQKDNTAVYNGKQEKVKINYN